MKLVLWSFNNMIHEIQPQRTKCKLALYVPLHITLLFDEMIRIEVIRLCFNELTHINSKFFDYEVVFYPSQSKKNELGEL
jgi:hypothetical protein